MVSKQVVGWQIGATMPEELVTRALHQAVRSQGRCGDCYDNAQAQTDQRFWMPVVAPQNEDPRTARAARFCRPSRRTGQRRRLF